MDIRAAIRDAILMDARVTAIVGSRVFPLRAPQGERQPLIVVTRISEREDRHMQGGDGLMISRVQIDCWAPDTDSASRLAETVRQRLQGLAGHFAGIWLSGVFAESVFEDVDDETGQWRVSRDFTVYAR